MRGPTAGQCSVKETECLMNTKSYGDGRIRDFTVKPFVGGPNGPDGLRRSRFLADVVVVAVVVIVAVVVVVLRTTHRWRFRQTPTMT